MGAAIQVDDWKHSLDGVRFDVDNYQKGLFLESGNTIRIEELGAEDSDVF